MADTQKRMAQPERTIKLRGYVREVARGRHLAVCLTLNLMVEAPTQRKALGELHGLMSAYIQDAIENNELDQFVPRRAPLQFYIEYLAGRTKNRLVAAQRTFKAFKDCHRLPVHA